MTEPHRIEEFVRLVTTHEPRLSAFAMSMVANHADADDILQKAYVVMLEKFDQFDPGTSFMSWAGRVVYLTTLQHQRKHQREKVRFGQTFFDAVAKATLEEDTSEYLNERMLALSECISKLKPEQEAMLRARYISDQSIDEMETRFNRSAESIYKVLSRTRRLLHECVSFKLRTEAFDAR
jgi:RNA polymerase sigma-70 factor (ECF subfamily)